MHQWHEDPMPLKYLQSLCYDLASYSRTIASHGITLLVLMSYHAGKAWHYVAGLTSLPSAYVN